MMAGNGVSSVRNGGASISAATADIGSPTRFHHHHHHHERRRRWGGCWGGLSCFGSQKGGKRIVPATRIPEGNTSGNRANGPTPAGSHQTTTISPSLLAPPSSPTSFTNSAPPSTAQSPSCFLSLSANSPGGPSSSMYATGPYANETQLVSPPVFSTYTTEPSTAPFTPPPELNHLTTPSSPDVPYAQFLSSSLDLKSGGKSGYVSVNDLQATYPLYPESPASSLISPISRTSGDGGLSSSFPDRLGTSISPQDSQYPRSPSARLFGLDTTASKNFMLSQDPGFFCPATSAQFYLDQAQQSHHSYPHNGGRLSVSREADVHMSDGKHGKKADVEEVEAYRASFGFSADEIITTPHYVEISDDVLDENFTIAPFASCNLHLEDTIPEMLNGEENKQTTRMKLLDFRGPKSTSVQVLSGVHGKVKEHLHNGFKDHRAEKQASGEASEHRKLDENHAMTDEEDIFSMMGSSKSNKRYHRLGSSSSDAEIDYRRGKSLREGRFCVERLTKR